MISVRTRSAEETRRLAAAIAGLVRSGDVLVLAGDLGAGKTVFVQGLAHGLGVEERVVSPTFALVRSYRGRLPLVHADVYRLERVSELEDLGLDEHEDAVVCVEWGDVLGPYLPADRLEVRLELPGDAETADDDRVVVLVTQGGSWRSRAEALEEIAGSVAGARS